MTVEHNPNGSITISAIVTNRGGERYREHMNYYDYTTREARARFKQHLKDNHLEEVKNV